MYEFGCQLAFEQSNPFYAQFKENGLYYQRIADWREIAGECRSHQV
jgi:hypothetical protein